MGEIFKPDSKTIINLFAGPVSYQIPSYQRLYSWDTERVEQLWDDLFSAFEENTEEYFLGSIILIKKGDNIFEVVDGQQRLTTLTILFCVLRDVYYNNISDKTKANLVLGRIKNLETDEKRLKFRTQAHHQNKFEQEIINGIDFNKKRTRKEIESDPFINAAYVFKDKINASQTVILDKIENFTNYILNKVRVITIECSSQTFAIKLFQILNTRGMDLTPSDLIKSDLMSRLKEEDLALFEQDWIYVETKAKEFGEELSSLFTYYEYYLLGSNPKKSLEDELVKQFSNKDPKKVIYDFKKLIQYFSDIDGENSKLIYSLGYLKHDVYWKSILLSAKLEGWDKVSFDQLARLLRNFYYLYWVAEYTSSKIKQTSFNIISWIKNKKDFNYIQERIVEKIKEDKVVVRVQKNLNEDIYSFAWCKPLFAVIEYAQTDDSVNEYIDLDKFVHIEHILPKGYAKIKYWTDLYSKEQAEKLVNTLGNLTLLSGKKNIDASNRPFSEKINIYKGKGIDGETSYRITQKIFDTIGSDKDWTSEKINLRRYFLINELSKIFEIDFNEGVNEEVGITKSFSRLYPFLEEEIMRVYPDIQVEHKKYYIAFKKKWVFASVVIQKKNLKLRLYLDKVKISEYSNLVKDVSERNDGRGNVEVIINKQEDIPFVLRLIQQSFSFVEQSSDEFRAREDKLRELNDEFYDLRRESEERWKKLKDELSPELLDDVEQLLMCKRGLDPLLLFITDMETEIIVLTEKKEDIDSNELIKNKVNKKILIEEKRLRIKLEKAKLDLEEVKAELNERWEELNTKLSKELLNEVQQFFSCELKNENLIDTIQNIVDPEEY